MKQNITLSIDKELIKNARVLAAKRQTSVSRMLSEELQKLIEDSNKYELAKKQALDYISRGFHLGGKLLFPEGNFMSGKVFVDTNILIYAHDLDAGQRNKISAAILRDLWENRIGIISTQVLQEFYLNVTRKIENPLPKSKARGVIENYLAWPVELNDSETVLSASEIEERYMLSFWDALIGASARNAKAEKILTEDLNHGQQIEGILIENPFVT